MNTNIYNVSKKFVKFLSVGLITYFCNIGIVFFVTDFGGKPFWWSVFLVFIFNITIVYLAQKHFTFRAKSIFSIRQYSMFVLWASCVMVLRYYSTIYVKIYFPATYYSLVSLIVIGCISIVNFVAQSFIFAGPRTGHK